VSTTLTVLRNESEEGMSKLFAYKRANVLAKIVTGINLSVGSGICRAV
jgi:hypothetical protein